MNRIDWDNPLTDHPYNRGVRLWCLPGTHPLWGGLQVRDFSGRRNNGTLTSGPTWSTQHPPGVGGSISIDATDDYLDFGTNSSLEIGGANNSFALMLWLKYTSADADFLSIWHKGGAGGVNSRTFQFFTSGSLGVVRFQQYDGATNPIADSSNRGNDGLWHYWIAVRDCLNSQMELYLDGELATTFSSDVGFSTNFNDAGMCSLGDARMGLNHSPALTVTDMKIISGWAPQLRDARILYNESRKGYPNLLRRLREVSYYFPQSGAISGTCAISTSSTTGTLTGSGALAGAAAVVFDDGTTILAGTGALIAVANIVFDDGSSTLTGSGALAGTTDLVFDDGTSTITGSGALAGATDMVFDDGTSVLAGAGALLGTSDLVFDDGSSTLTGSGVLAGTSDLVFDDGSSTLVGSGALAGSAAITFTTLLATSGSLLGTAAITFSTTGTISSPGAILGSAAMVFDPTATLTNIANLTYPIIQLNGVAQRNISLSARLTQRNILVTGSTQRNILLTADRGANVL